MPVDAPEGTAARKRPVKSINWVRSIYNMWALTFPGVELDLDGRVSARVEDLWNNVSAKHLIQHICRSGPPGARELW